MINFIDLLVFLLCGLQDLKVNLANIFFLHSATLLGVCDQQLAPSQHLIIRFTLPDLGRPICLGI